VIAGSLTHTLLVPWLAGGRRLLSNYRAYRDYVDRAHRGYAKRFNIKPDERSPWRGFGLAGFIVPPSPPVASFKASFKEMVSASVKRYLSVLAPIKSHPIRTNKISVLPILPIFG